MIPFLIEAGFFLVPIFILNAFLDPFTSAKWVALHGFTAILSLVLFFKKFPTEIRIYRNLTWGGIAFFLTYAFGYILHWPGAYEVLALETFSGIALFTAFLVLQANGMNPGRSLMLGSLCALALILGVALFETLGVDLWDGRWRLDAPGSLFGYPNLASEFVGLCLPFLFFLISEKKWKTHKLILIILLMGSLAYIGKAGSRSVYLAIVASAIVWAIATNLLSGKKAFVLGGVALVLAIGWWEIKPKLFEHELSTLEEIKHSTWTLRKIRWENTLRWIKDSPWGNGPGSFEFGYLPYSRSDTEANEDIIVKSPHNGYLELAVENGWLCFFVFIIFVCILITKVVQWRTVEEHSKLERAVFLSYFSIVSVQAFFAFPLETAPPFLLTESLLGWAIARLPSESSDIPISKRVLRRSFLVFALISGIGGSALAYGRWIEGKEEKTSVAQIRWSCDFLPSLWKACLLNARVELARKQPKEAEAILLRMLERQPSHFIARRLLSRALFDQNRREEGCKAIRDYDRLFDGRSSFHGQFSEMCPGL